MINVLSLYDGISAGRLALERSNIVVTNYYRAEIDKYANLVSISHYPNDIQLGDVRDWKTWDIPWSSIDLLIGGFPCQSFSFSGNQKGFEDERGSLFFIYLDILNHIKSLNPKIKFLAENVKMKQEYLNTITSSLQVEPVFINSNILSAQNRQRFYWCNWEILPIANRDISISNIVEDIPQGTVEILCGAKRGRYLIDGVRQDAKMKTAGLTIQRLEYRKDNKTNCLTTVQKDNVVVFRNNNNEEITRYLTVTEAARLQTFPDLWCNTISKTQALKAYGNSWTVDVIAQIFSCIKDDLC